MILHYAYNFHFFFTSYNQFSLANVLLESAGQHSPQTLLAIKDQFVFLVVGIKMVRMKDMDADH